MTDIIETLRGGSQLSEGEPVRFELPGAAEQSFQRGATIVRAREPRRSVFLVREGGVKESQVTPEGKEVILGLLGPGDLFGDLTGLGGETSTTSVTAMMATRATVVPRETWLEMLATKPELPRMVQAQLERRLADAWKLVRMLSRYTTEARLKSALLLLAERWGQEREEGMEIGLDLTHRTLADLAGASREKVTRALGLLTQKGLVKVVRRRLVVPSLERLQSE
jgi:CRP-like cAMP-binding protein